MTRNIDGPEIADCCARDFALAMNWPDDQPEAVPDCDDYEEDEQ